MKRNYNNSIGTLVKEHEFAELNCNCKPLHRKNDEGAESWREYDDQGRLISYRDNKGYEEHYTYNKNGTVTVKGPFGNILR